MWLCAVCLFLLQRPFVLVPLYLPVIPPLPLSSFSTGAMAGGRSGGGGGGEGGTEKMSMSKVNAGERIPD